MLRTTITTSLAAATLAGVAFAPSCTPAHADVAPRYAENAVYLGGTGTTAADAAKPVPNGFLTPFLQQPPAHATTVGYDGSPVANPQASVPLALAAIDAQPHDTTTVVIGVSKGAQVARGAEARDTRTDSRYVLIADPDGDHGISRAVGISPKKRTPTHDVTEIVAEYDGVGDFPDRPNPLAVANAIVGWAVIHPHYGSGKANDPLTRIGDGRTTITPNGNGTSTTHVLIPTKHLPLLKPLRDTELTLTHQSRNTDGLEKALRPVVDSGYSRNSKQPASDAPKATTPKHDNGETAAKASDAPKHAAE